MAMDSMTDVFKVLSKQPSLQNVQDSMEMISRYTVVMNNRTSNSTNVFLSILVEQLMFLAICGM